MNRYLDYFADRSLVVPDLRNYGESTSRQGSIISVTPAKHNDATPGARARSNRRHGWGRTDDSVGEMNRRGRR